MNIAVMMLQVLDDPTSVRIIVSTKYPNIETDDDVYFMVDRSNGGVVLDNEEAGAFDYWLVTDSLGQSRKFDTNIELIEFLDSISDVTKRVYTESF